MNEDWVFKRGDLYYANLNPYFGSEQGAYARFWCFRTIWATFFVPP